MDTVKIEHKTVSYEVYYTKDSVDHIAIFDSYLAATHFSWRNGVQGKVVTHIQQPSCVIELSQPSRHFEKWYNVAKEALLDARVQDYSDEEIKRAFKHSIGRQFWFDVVQEMRLNGEIL